MISYKMHLEIMLLILTIIIQFKKGLLQHVLLVLFLLPAYAGLGADDKLNSARPFLEKYCYECHGAEEQKGGIRLDDLGNDLTKYENLEIWQHVLDQLNLGEMPPKKKAQPTIAEVEQLTELLNGELKEAYAKAKSTDGQTVLRRLNRHELRNTFRDLLYEVIRNLMCT